MLGSLFERFFIVDKFPQLLTECSSIIAEERWSDLSLLYGLVKTIEGGLTPVIRLFGEYMRKREEMLIKISAPGPDGPKSPDEFVNRIMSFCNQYNMLINHVFDGDSKFTRILDQTWMNVLNHNPNSDTHCPAIDWVRYLLTLLLLLLLLLFFFLMKSNARKGAPD